MARPTIFALLLWGATALIPAATADEIVQEGSLSGFGAPTTHDVVLEQFDTQGGTRQLNFVRLDFLTSTAGGYTTDGSGIPVDILSQLDANYSLGSTPLADTQALIQMTVPNPSGVPPLPVSVFDTDTAEVVIDDPAELAPWIGTGEVTMSAFTEFVVSEDPPDVIFFSAGGSVQYTVTYDFDFVVLEPFSRGDANADGAFDIADAILTLDALFGTAPPLPPCLDAADANDDGVHDISDAIYTLSALFVPGSPPPPAPFPSCDVDLTVDTLGCEAYGACP